MEVADFIWPVGKARRRKTRELNEEGNKRRALFYVSNIGKPT